MDHVAVVLRIRLLSDLHSKIRHVVAIFHVYNNKILSKPNDPAGSDKKVLG